MKDSKLPFFDGFVSFLKEQMPSSSNSYKNYLNNVIKAIAENDGYILSAVLSEVSSVADLSRIQEIILMKCDELEDKDKKTKCNWKSAIRKYFAYLAEQYDSIGETETSNEVKLGEDFIDDADNQNANSSSLTDFRKIDDNYITHKELFDIFTTRLKTDDRFQKNSIYIPMRLINSVLSNSSYGNQYKKWKENLIENTVIITERGIARLKNINGIRIDRPFLYVHFKLDGVEPSKLFTYSKEGGRIEPFTTYKVNAKGLAENFETKEDIKRNMSREHFPECSLMALSNPSPFKALPKITDICKNYGILNGSDLKTEMKNNIQFKNDIANQVNLNDLFDDILMIESFQTVTIMASSSNSAKGGTKSANSQRINTKTTNNNVGSTRRSHSYSINNKGNNKMYEVIGKFIDHQLSVGRNFASIKAEIDGVVPQVVSDISTGVKMGSRGKKSHVYTTNNGTTIYITTELMGSKPNHNFVKLKDYLNNRYSNFNIEEI